MKHRSNQKTLTVGCCIVLGAGWLAAAPAQADPQERPNARAAHAQGAQDHRPHGSYTRTTQRQRTADGRQSKTVYTDAKGRTATRDATVVNDEDAGTRTRDATYTGRDGATRTVDSVAQKTDDGFTRATTYTDKDGDTATRDVELVHDRDTHTTTKTVTVDRNP